ncbi:MAG: hypothetical protein K2X27_24285 [Candidatus Obscuribacterales bacterium]|nr:hypothetical protein [Candidatus Obscuribacterales bacterium]
MNCAVKKNTKKIAALLCSLVILPLAEAGAETTEAAIASYGQSVRKKLQPLFKANNITYPPAAMTWLALKEEKQLLIFARDKTGKEKQIMLYPIIGASGKAGPKLKEGDKQVPEGFYKINGFRPNVIAHLGLSVNYPNLEDRTHAAAEGRKNLGGDILIHGSRWSTGCLAMGNPCIEDLFVLAHDSGCDNIQLIFAPCDLRTHKPASENKAPDWLPKLYERLKNRLATLPISVTGSAPGG